jgi:hypothetical protein
MYIHEIEQDRAPLPNGAALTPGRSPFACRGATTGTHRVAGQERREVRRHADRAHARAAAAVRDAERLVQVQVADVGAEVAGRHRPTCAFMLAPSM